MRVSTVRFTLKLFTASFLTYLNKQKPTSGQLVGFFIWGFVEEVSTCHSCLWRSKNEMKKLGHYYGLASKEGVILISYEYNITVKCEDFVTKTLSKLKSD